MIEMHNIKCFYYKKTKSRENKYLIFHFFPGASYFYRQKKPNSLCVSKLKENYFYKVSRFAPKKIYCKLFASKQFYSKKLSATKLKQSGGWSLKVHSGYI